VHASNRAFDGDAQKRRAPSTRTLGGIREVIQLRSNWGKGFVRWAIPTLVVVICLALYFLTPFSRRIEFLTWIWLLLGSCYFAWDALKESRTTSAALTPSEREKSRNKRFELVAVFVATIGGLLGLSIYHETNVLTVRNALESRDSESRVKYFGEDGKQGGERMALIFFNSPDGTFTEEACESRRDEVRQWAKEAVLAVVDRGHLDKIPEWNSVMELYDLLFDRTTVANDGMHDVRRAFFHVVDYFYIVHDAFQAKEKHIFGPDEYEMWASYIDDLGPNPYHLMTIIDAHERGYMTKAFSDEIWRRFSKAQNPQLNCFAKILYPELAVADLILWRRDWGSRRGTGSPKIPAVIRPASNAAQPSVPADGAEAPRR